MSAWIKKIHIYAGLFNFTILYVFGLAGIVVTAEAPDIFHAGNQPVVESVPFQAPGSASDKEVGEIIAAKLRPRNAGKPNVRRNADHQLVADFYSVNGLVRVTLLENEAQLRVETLRNSIWRFIDNAHATTIQETASEWAPSAWAWYVEISIWSLLLMALTGAWLGITARWNYWWTKAALAAGTAAFFIFYVVEK
jgi:hypothetical protein